MTVRIGGGQGFYGDGLGPVPDVLEAGVDYLVCEALAELTLAILQKDRQRDESLGFTRDLPMYVSAAALPYVVDGRTRFITNAGGINPVAAGRAVVSTLKEAGATGLLVATVVGDDVRPRAADLGLPPDALFANAYLGARPIVEALDAGAHVVVTGRVADASLFLAPLVHEHKWAWDDWDRLAAGVVVGHLLECSGQVAGGNYSGPWWTNPDPLRIAFPIGECEPDGSAVITKPAQSGGMVTFDTVREQLLYEVHDPARYLNPDVVADFTSLTLTDLGGDRVRVSGTRGLPRPTDVQGSRVHARRVGPARPPFAYPWPDAEAKARAAVAVGQAARDRREDPGRGMARGVLRRQRVRRADCRRRSGRRRGMGAARGHRTACVAMCGRGDRGASGSGERRARAVRSTDHQWLRSRSRWQADAAARSRCVRGRPQPRRSAGARRSRRSLTVASERLRVRPEQGQTRYGPPP